LQIGQSSPPVIKAILVVAKIGASRSKSSGITAAVVVEDRAAAIVPVGLGRPSGTPGIATTAATRRFLISHRGLLVDVAGQLSCCSNLSAVLDPWPSE
jgi:hypothetical protein